MLICWLVSHKQLQYQGKREKNFKGSCFRCTSQGFQIIPESLILNSLNFAPAKCKSVKLTNGRLSTPYARLYGNLAFFSLHTSRYYTCTVLADVCYSCFTFTVFNAFQMWYFVFLFSWVLSGKTKPMKVSHYCIQLLACTTNYRGPGHSCFISKAIFW